VVDPNVAKDLPRVHLFRILGVKDFKINSITQLIFSNHSDKSFDPNSVSRADLISHMHFLYTTGWRNIDASNSGLPWSLMVELRDRPFTSTMLMLRIRLRSSSPTTGGSFSSSIQIIKMRARGIQAADSPGSRVT